MRIGVLTVSDRSAIGLRADLTGPALARLVLRLGWSVEKQAVLPDERGALEVTMAEWCDSDTIDVLLTAGGTGLAERDVTPEATRAVVDREVPGIGEALREVGRRKTPHAMLSRAIAGVRAKTLIANLPGSPTAASESLEVIAPALEHAVQLIRGDPRSESNH